MLRPSPKPAAGQSAKLATRDRATWALDRRTSRRGGASARCPRRSRSATTRHAGAKRNSSLSWTSLRLAGHRLRSCGGLRATSVRATLPITAVARHRIGEVHEANSSSVDAPSGHRLEKSYLCQSRDNAMGRGTRYSKPGHHAGDRRRSVRGHHLNHGEGPFDRRHPSGKIVRMPNVRGSPCAATRSTSPDRSGLSPRRGSRADATCDAPRPVRHKVPRSPRATTIRGDGEGYIVA